MNLGRRKALVVLPALVSSAMGQPLPTGSVKRIGFITGGHASHMQALEQDIGARMAMLGWKPGANLLIEGVHADGKLDSLPSLAEQLVRRRVDVIVTGGSETTIAAARATQTIPIVFQSVHYPVEQGLVRSYARPAGNVTGPALFHGLELTTKRLEFLRELAPAARRLAWVWPQELFDLPTLAGRSNDLRPSIVKAAAALGFDATCHTLHGPDDLDAIFNAVALSGAQALAGGMAGAPEPMTHFALRRNLPSAFPMRYFVAAGGLLSYGPLEADVQRGTERAVIYVDRILRGAKPGELAVEQPSRFELVLNAKTAKAIGISLPRGMMIRADGVLG